MTDTADKANHANDARVRDYDLSMFDDNGKDPRHHERRDNHRDDTRYDERGGYNDETNDRYDPRSPRYIDGSDYWSMYYNTSNIPETITPFDPEGR